jgi:hypothetical protein
VLPNRARLVLGDEYALNLIPLPATEAPACEIENLQAWRGPAEKNPLAPLRAVVCEPVDGHVITRHSVWLFSDVGFGLDAAGNIVWDARGRGISPAAFHYLRGCFWLRNDSLPAAMLAINDQPLEPGEIFPFSSCRMIRIGNHTFAVHIE